MVKKKIFNSQNEIVIQHKDNQLEREKERQRCENKKNKNLFKKIVHSIIFCFNLFKYRNIKAENDKIK